MIYIAGTPKQDQWRFNEVQCVTSHNSFEKRYLPKNVKSDDPNWRFKSIKHQLDKCRVRGLEFDIHEENNQYYVYHTVKPKDCFKLQDWLEAVKKWAENYKSKNGLMHEIIVIYLDLKKIQNIQNFPAKIDKIIRNFLPEGNPEDHIFTPRKLLRDYHNEWPTLGKLRGKFIFVLSGGNIINITNHGPKEQYEKSPGYAFVDVSPFKLKIYRRRRFINTYALTHFMFLTSGMIQEAIADQKIIRTWMTNEETILFDVMNRGVNLLGTDSIDNLVRWNKINPLILEDNSGYQLILASSSAERKIYELVRRIYNIEKRDQLWNYIFFSLFVIAIILLMIIIYLFFY